jgi:hypothetical protein
MATDDYLDEPQWVRDLTPEQRERLSEQWWREREHLGDEPNWESERLVAGHGWSAMPVSLVPHEFAPRDWPEGETAVCVQVTRDGWTLESWWRTLDGRSEPVEVRIFSLTPPAPYGTVVTGDAIRKLQLGQMLADSRMWLRQSAMFWFRHPSTMDMARSDPQISALAEELILGGKPQRGQALSNDDLENVADVYRSAWIDGEPVNEAVRRAFHLSKDGAAKRIMVRRGPRACSTGWDRSDDHQEGRPDAAHGSSSSTCRALTASGVRFAGAGSPRRRQPRRR